MDRPLFTVAVGRMVAEILPFQSETIARSPKLACTLLVHVLKH